MNKKFLKQVTLKRMLLVVLGFIALQIFVFVFGIISRQPWSKAFDHPGTVKHVNLKVHDHIDEWNDIDSLSNIVIGASGHWTGNNGIDVPRNKPGYVWYDGHLVASEPVARDLQLSPNGLHYGYVRSSDYPEESDDSYQELIIDGKVYIGGTSIRLFSLPDDTRGIYYSCANCGESKSGLYRGDTKLTSYDKTMEDTNQDLANGLCFVNPAIDIQKLYALLNEPDAVGVSCSANGQHIMTEKVRDLFPVGNDSVVSIDGREAADGGVMSQAVDNDGSPSYLNSNGVGGGELIIKGKRYTLDGHKLADGELLFDEFRNHMAVALKGDRGDTWWFDGRETNAKANDVVSLDDDTFYVYRFADE